MTRVERYPHGLSRVAGRAPPGPWMYTGGLENHPRLVARIAARRPLLGNPADVLRRVRDPGEVKAALYRAGLGLLDEHLRHCVTDAVASGGDEADRLVTEASRAIERLVRS